MGLILERIHNFLNFTQHTQLKNTPQEIIEGINVLDPFNRDIVVETTYNRKKFLDYKQEQINKNKQNKKFWKENELVLVKNHFHKKMELKYEGPYKIIKVELKNNRIKIENKNKTQWESLRNIKPFYKRRGGCDDTPVTETFQI